jgi:hypothetical protein
MDFKGSDARSISIYDGPFGAKTSMCRVTIRTDRSSIWESLFLSMFLTQRDWWKRKKDSDVLLYFSGSEEVTSRRGGSGH